MLIYHRYASGDVERASQAPPASEPSSAPTTKKSDLLGPMRGGLGARVPSNDAGRWPQVIEHAHYFIGVDPSVFGPVVIMVFKNVALGHLCTRLVLKYGVTCYNDLMLDKRSRFAVASDNLIPEYRHLKLRQALAVTLLKNFSLLANNCTGLTVNMAFDETNAGEVALSMQKLRTGPSLRLPQVVGQLLLRLGLAVSHRVPAYVVDTVYPPTLDALLEHLGSAVDLFDPLLEYSPQTITVTYTPPTTATDSLLVTDELNHTLHELLLVQTNYTMNLVNLLQDFIVPLRLFFVNNDLEAKVARINRIFPPTVDEITRVNCILHDALVKAEPHGAAEVLKAMALIIPYFYKPFIRHQANLKHFHRRFDHFYRHHHPEIFTNPDINRGGFSVAEIDLVILGAVGELPKLKMLLDRLVPLVLDACGDDERLRRQCVGYHRACVDIIDAFGDDGPAPALAPSSRVFTPSGQMLADLASNWPLALDHGWLHRKMVGIFELRRVSDGAIDVLVVFSDCLMWLTVSDPLYATGELPVYVLDTLMHSLVNEKPLPTLGVIPAMTVRCWGRAAECMVLLFDDQSGATLIRFLSTTESGFRVHPGAKPIFGEVYAVLPVSGGKRPALPDTIIEVVAKLMVVDKAHPLRLSRSLLSDTSGARAYFASQTADVYGEELLKLPFALYLEVLDPLEIAAAFEANHHLRLVMTAHICEDDRDCLVVLAQLRLGNVVVDQRLISSLDLPKFVRKMVNDTHKLAFDTANGASRALINLSSHQLTQWCHDNRDIASQLFSPTVYPLQQFLSTEIAETPKARNRQLMAATPKAMLLLTTTVEPSKPRPQSMSAVLSLLALMGSKRRLFIGLLFLLMLIKRKLVPDQLAEGFTRLELAQKNLDSTFIPRGQRHEYKHLYLAQPDLVTSKPTTPLVARLPSRSRTTRVRNVTAAVPIAATTTVHANAEPMASAETRRPRLEDDEFTDALLGLMLSATPLARRLTAPTLRQLSTKDSTREPNVVRMGLVLTKADTSGDANIIATSTPGPSFMALATNVASTSAMASAPVSATGAVIPIIGTPMGLSKPPQPQPSAAIAPASLAPPPVPVSMIPSLTLMGSVEPTLQRKLIFKVDLPWHNNDGLAISEIMPESTLPTSDLFNANMYSDGGLNWILITRDNLLLFVANADLTEALIEENTRATFEENNDDENEGDDDTTAQEEEDSDSDDDTPHYEPGTEPSKTINDTSLELSDHQAEHLVEDFVTRFDRDVSEMFTPEELRSIRMLLATKAAIPRSDSVQLVTPLMYARELGAQLDRLFSSRHLLLITQLEYETKMSQARASRRLVSVEEEEELGETPVRYQSYSSTHQSPEELKRFSAYVVRRQEARYLKYVAGYDSDVKYAVDRLLSGLSDATIYDESDNVLDYLDYRGITLA